MPDDVFDLLVRSKRLQPAQADALKRMVAFRNIAVHDYQALSLPILVRIITERLDELTEFTQTLLQHDAARRN